jgi:hypothetical protein
MGAAVQAETRYVLDDFSTDTMVANSLSGSSGSYQYQWVDANWVSSYVNGLTPPATWGIVDGQLKVLNDTKTLRVGRIFAVDFSSNVEPANWSLEFQWIAGRSDRIDDFDVYVGIPTGKAIPDPNVVWQMQVGQTGPDPSADLATWLKLTPNWSGNVGPLTSGQVISFNLDDQGVFTAAGTDLTGYALLAVSYLHVKSNPATVLDNFALHSITDPSTGPDGDADGNGVVDAADYIMIKTNFGGVPSGAGTGGDLSGNGVVDWADLNIFAGALPPSGESPSIPEPATLALLAAGALGVLRRRRV